MIRPQRRGEKPCLPRYVDADGHVMENLQEMSEFLAPTFAGARTDGMLPSLDTFHTPRPTATRTPGTFDSNIGPDGWIQFLNKTSDVLRTRGVGGNRR